MASDNKPRTTCYGRKDNNIVGTALEAFKKVALGMVAALVIAVGSSQAASASERNQEVQPLTKVEQGITIPARAFELQRDQDDALSITATNEVRVFDQWRLETALRSDGGRSGIQVSVLINTPTGDLVLKTLCADPAPGSKSSCLVFAVGDRSINFDRPMIVIPDLPSPEGVLRQRNLPQNSAAERQVEVTRVSVNLLDPALVAPVNKYRDNPNERNWVDMVGAFKRSIAKFVSAPEQTYTSENDGRQGPPLRFR